jgi:hypothetical protein
VTAALAAILALRAGTAGADPAPPDRPRWTAGATFGLAQVEAGAAEREEAIAYGLRAGWRPLRFAAVSLRLQREPVSHAYRAFRFDTAYHRSTLALEGRLPIGNFDAALLAGPELVYQRSTLESPGTRPPSRERLTWALAYGGAAIYRVWRLELRADVGASWRDKKRTDLLFGLATSWTWQ